MRKGKMRRRGKLAGEVGAECERPAQNRETVKVGERQSEERRASEREREREGESGLAKT